MCREVQASSSALNLYTCSSPGNSVCAGWLSASSMSRNASHRGSPLLNLCTLRFSLYFSTGVLHDCLCSVLPAQLCPAGGPWGQQSQMCSAGGRPQCPAGWHQSQPCPAGGPRGRQSQTCTEDKDRAQVDQTEQTGTVRPGRGVMVTTLVHTQWSTGCQPHNRAG